MLWQNLARFGFILITIMKSLSVYMMSLMKTECFWASHQSRWYEPHCHLTVTLLGWPLSAHETVITLRWAGRRSGGRRRQTTVEGKWMTAVREWVMIVLPLIKSRQAHSHKAHFLLSVYLKTHRPVWKWRCWILAAQLMLIGLFKGIVHLKTKTYVFLRCSFNNSLWPSLSSSTIE